MVIFTFTMRRHLIRLASGPFISSRLATFGWVRFPRSTRGKHVMQNFRRVGENSDPILSRLWTKAHEIFRRCRKPLSDCLCHVSFRRYSPLSLEVVEKQSKCESFWPPIFVGETAPTLRQFVRATSTHYLAKFS